MPGKDNIQAKCWNVSSLHPAHQRAVPPNDVVHCFYVFPPSFLSSASFGSLWDAQSCLASFNASCRPNHPKIRRVFYFSLWCLLFVYGPCSTLAHRCDGSSSAPPLPSSSHTDTCSVYHLAFLHPLFVWSDHTIGLQIFLIKEREPGIQVALAAFLILEQEQTNWLSRSKSQNSCFAKGAAKSSVRPSRSWSTLALGSPQTND